MKQSRTYSLLIIVVLFIVFSLAGCSPSTNEPISPTVNSTVSTPTPEIQQTETPLLSQLMAEPVEIAMNPNGIKPENVDDLTFLTRFWDKGQELVWSPDNKTFAVTSYNSISLYDARSFVLINTLKAETLWQKESIPNGSPINTYSIEYSPNGKFLAFNLFKQANQIYIMDVPSFEILEVISLDINNTAKFKFSSDSTGLIITERNEIRIWNLFTLDFEAQKSAYLSKAYADSDFFALSPDGNMYVSGNYNDQPILSESVTGKQIATLNEEFSISSIDFSADGKFIIAADRNYSVTIWDSSGNKITTLSTYRKWYGIQSFAINPDNTILAVANSLGYIDIFDINSGVLLKTLDTEYYSVRISFNADGSILSGENAENGIAFWTTDQEIMTSVSTNHLPDQEIINNFSSLPAGKYILFATGEGMNVIAEDGYFQKEISSTKQGDTISADGRILTNLNSTFSNDSSGYINLLTGESQKTEHLGAISPNLKWIAETDYCNPQVEQYGIEGVSIKANTSFCTYVDELILKENDRVREMISPIKWSPDASKLAFVKFTLANLDYVGEEFSVLSSNGLYVTDTSCFRDPRTCNEKTKQEIFFPFEIHCGYTTNELYLKWSPDGRYVVLNNGTMFVVSDLKTKTNWKLEKTPVILENFPQYFGISPDNKYIAYSEDWTNIVIKPMSNEPAYEIASGMENVQVLGWIMAPLLETGETFKVLPDGNHTRIYKQAGFERQQIGTLYDNNTFTVLDGPVQEDGYTWWYIHSDVDGVEGWIPEFYEWYEKVEATE